MYDYGYDWDGIGLTIKTPCGELYIQGEEGSDLFDLLERIETNEELEQVLCEYEDLCE